eukprot:303846-Rhodomonas_salina.1
MHRRIAESSTSSLLSGTPRTRMFPSTVRRMLPLLAAPTRSQHHAAKRRIATDLSAKRRIATDLSAK